MPQTVWIHLEPASFAQPGDVNIDGAGIAVEVVSPHILDQTFAVHHQPLMLGERGQEIELLAAKGERFPVKGCLASGHVNVEIARLEDHGRLGGVLRAPEHRLDAGHQLTRVEQACVVVGTQFQPNDLVDVVGAAVSMMMGTLLDLRSSGRRRPSISGIITSRTIRSG
jgi:hypothetical protein